MIFLRKFLHHALQLFTYAVVAEIAYAALVGVVHFTGRFIGVVLHLHAHLAVGLAEGNARESKAVHILHGEEVVVLAVAEDVRVHTDVLQHHVAHGEA